MLIFIINTIFHIILLKLDLKSTALGNSFYFFFFYNTGLAKRIVFLFYAITLYKFSYSPFPLTLTGSIPYLIGVSYISQ